MSALLFPEYKKPGVSTISVKIPCAHPKCENPMGGAHILSSPSAENGRVHFPQGQPEFSRQRLTAHPELACDHMLDLQSLNASL